jgi:hypothetical protein
MSPWGEIGVFAPVIMSPGGTESRRGESRADESVPYSFMMNFAKTQTDGIAAIVIDKASCFYR